MEHCEPVIKEGPIGWLAVTPHDYPYRIGVVGNSVEEAKNLFDVELAAWEELHERAIQEA